MTSRKTTYGQAVQIVKRLGLTIVEQERKSIVIRWRSNDMEAVFEPEQEKSAFGTLTIKTRN